MVLIRNAEVGGEPGLDVRVGPDRVEEIGPGLDRGRGEVVVAAAGGAVIPGLHDHHVHLRAAVAAKQSVAAAAAANPAGFDALITASAAAAQPGRWLRVTGWDEHRSGPLDRDRLDALTGSVPARVQHRSGAMWVLNSAALRAVGADGCDLPGVERDAGGVLTGRLLRLDEWLRGRLPAAARGDFAAGLAAYAAEAASLGVTGFTDATPGRDQADVDALGALAQAGTLLQRLVLMAPPGLRLTAGRGRIALGPRKVILDDATLPPVAELAALIAAAHREAAAVAVHCVTAEQLIVCAAAFEQAGRVPVLADRVEHAGVVPAGYPGLLARLGLTVVTQPGFISARGDAYLEHVPAAEQDWLYPCATLLASGVAVAGSTDAPFGPADPWLAIAAASTRRTASGRVLGPAERVCAGAALRLFLADPLDPRRTRTVAVGQPADLCVLRAPLAAALAAPAGAMVRATVAGGRLLAA
jgi:predicted amidohydrolase YtcJ